MGKSEIRYQLSVIDGSKFPKKSPLITTDRQLTTDHTATAPQMFPVLQLLLLQGCSNHRSSMALPWPSLPIAAAT